MIEGMDTVVATVSGYHGSERMKLIKLIALAGANYVGKMSRSTTHLVCWEFKGRKYELAKKFGTLTLNHKWLEECVKEGKRIPEQPYTQQSGLAVGLIGLNFPGLRQPPDLQTENMQPLNKPNIRDRLREVIDLDSDEIENDDWDVDCLLDENLFPNPGSSRRAPRRSKRKVDKENLKEGRRAKAHNRSIREPQIPTVPRLQGRSDNWISMGTDFAESSRRSRRLVRRDVDRNVIESATIDVEQQSRTPAYDTDLMHTSRPNNDSNAFRGETEANVNRRLEASSAGCGRSDDEDNHLNDIGDLGNACLPYETSPDVEVVNEQLENGYVHDRSTKLPTSSKVACVICLTEYSSTRGVLPCGHRFCFKCIQNWADRMASQRKETTCPLCKASFASITRVDDSSSLDQKIYSQSIPNPSSTQDIFFVPEGGAGRPETEIRLHLVCCICHNQDPEDQDRLVYCHCDRACIHDYCLDPPMFPWACTTCRDIRLPYYR